MKPIFAYLRVSGVSQKDGDGYDRQLAACEAYAAAHDLEIAGVFRESMTGRSDLESRIALGELLDQMEGKKVKTIIVEKLDRVARDLMVQETIIGDLRRRGLTLISTAEPDLCSDEPSRVLIRQIFGALAQWERACICLKLKAAKERKRASDPAYHDGPLRYGQKPGEAAVLLKMRSWRSEGRTLEWITGALNLEQIPARGRGSWTIGSVGRILAR